MKKYILILFVITIIVSCTGKDGDDGNAYLKIKLYSGVTSYWDNNPSIPYGFSQSTFYHCSPGTYSYEYDLDDGYYWHGTYKLTIEEGTEGEIFWQDGDDGRDKYYTLKCYYGGPDLDVSYYVYKENKNNPDIITIRDNRTGDLVEIEKKIGNHVFKIIAIKEIRKDYSENISKITEKVEGKNRK